MRSLFFGAYGFGNLGDELCLLDALRAFPSSEAWAFSGNPSFTERCTGVTRFVQRREQVKEVRPERVVLGGGALGTYPNIRNSLHWMRDAWRLGAQCHIYNIGVARIENFEWLDDPDIRELLAALRSCSVRDHVSEFCMREWPIRLRPSITYYPERTLPPSMELTHLLPRDKPMLGISIISQPVMCQALEKNAALIRQYLEGFRDHTIVPIVSTVHLSASEENDIEGFKFFEDLFLRDFDVCCREFLDKSWWLENMTPLRLKGVISQLSTLLSQRKHNGIHAIGSGVRLVGIHPENDDSVPRVFFSLRSRMPLKSYCFALPIEG